jgi:hypothetical protein
MAEDAMETINTVETNSLVLRSLLANKAPDVQGAILGDVVSYWLASCKKENREAVFLRWISLVNDLIPMSEEDLNAKNTPRTAR